MKPLPESAFGFVPRLIEADANAERRDGPDEDMLRCGPRCDKYLFHSQQLPDDRAVTVFLPEAYHDNPTLRFPVFYLHDGQNLFDGRTSYVPGCTWRAHSTADSLLASGDIRPVILVGIANTGLRRMAEYTPTRDFRMGGGEGRQYGRLLIEELKPLIDAGYRTLAGPSDTALGGSSLGGLISLYLGFENPGVFGNLAVISPSLWWDHRSILNFVARSEPRPRPRIWLDMGTAEGIRHLRDCDLLYKILLSRGWKAGFDLDYTRVNGGMHNEEAWAVRFGDVLRFLFPASRR